MTASHDTAHFEPTGAAAGTPRKPWQPPVIEDAAIAEATAKYSDVGEWTTIKAGS